MQVTATNRGPDAAPLHILPQLWARNTWSWEPNQPKPLLQLDGHTVTARHPRLQRIPRVRGGRRARSGCSARTRPTSRPPLRLAKGTGLAKDGINDHVVGRPARHRQPVQHRGTKCAAHLRMDDRTRRQRHRAPAPAPGPDGRRVRLVRHHHGRPPQRGGRVLRRRPAGHGGCGRPPRAAPGLCRHAVVQAVLHVRHPHVAGRRPAAAARRRRSARPDGTASGVIWTTATSFRCPTRGNTRGMPRGTWRSTAPPSPDRSGVRQGPAPAADAGALHAPERPAARPTSGRSAT